MLVVAFSHIYINNSIQSHRGSVQTSAGRGAGTAADYVRGFFLFRRKLSTHRRSFYGSRLDIGIAEAKLSPFASFLTASHGSLTSSSSSAHRYAIPHDVGDSIPPSFLSTTMSSSSEKGAEKGTLPIATAPSSQPAKRKGLSSVFLHILQVVIAVYWASRIANSAARHWVGCTRRRKSPRSIRGAWSITGKAPMIA
jgi:hypothetical protein